MKRENRYLVLKRTDLDAALEPHQVNDLNDICEAVSEYRAERGARPMRCVVVEDDWPEYEPVWAMIERRMDSHNDKRVGRL